MNSKKVLIGLSGGVDSSVAAYLLKEQGYEVIGVTLKLMQAASEIDDAAAVCEKLGIKHIVIDYSQQFKEQVVDEFAREYSKGRTPNPCVRCNRHIKWAALLKAADEMGAQYIATGHYAKVTDDGALMLTGGKSQTGTAQASEQTVHSKDQTYALCMVTKDQLARTLMPLANYTKDEVRKIAASVGLPTASKSDSMDICFVPDGDYAKFLREEYCKNSLDDSDVKTGNNSNASVEANSNSNEKVDAAKLKKAITAPGNFVNSEGKILGTHKGIAHYTVGQRRGLGISADRSLYVIKIRPETNEVVLGYEEEVYSDALIAKDVNWLIDAPFESDEPQNPIEVTVKIRYNHKGAAATLVPIKEGMEEADPKTEPASKACKVQVTFKDPQKAITPGQFAVFYKDGQLIGGGTIV